MASDFNYSLPKHRKGYNTVGYKCPSGDSRDQWGHHFSTNTRPSHGNDKGYYSDHTYESPIPGKGQMANSATIGYQEVNPDVNGTENELRQTSHSDRTLTFPRFDKPVNFDVDHVA